MSDTVQDQPEALNMVRAAAAELVGTLVLVLVGTAVAVAAILGRQIAGSPYDSLAIALAFGLVLVALVGALGHTSGCHLNPAVTLGLASIGKFPWRYVPVYIAAQMVGAVLAGFALWGAYGSQARTVAHLGATARPRVPATCKPSSWRCSSGSCWCS